VMPADAPSTRSLIACRDLIEARCFPLPGLAAFDLLNNKWDFTQLALSLGIRCPASRRFADAAAFGDEIARGKIAFPVVVKPLDMSGNQGCLVMDGAATQDRLREINYQPLIVQEFINGEDIGASVFARSGDIAAFIAHRFAGNVYSTFRDDGIEADLARLARHLDLDGVYNFDMRLTPDQEVFYLECNPRFFYKIALSMVAGINFVGLGLAGIAAGIGTGIPSAIPDGTRVQLPKALARSPRRLLRGTRRDLLMAAHLYADPLPHLLERAGILV
jgi:carbamoylphosphate synthase large subunit